MPERILMLQPTRSTKSSQSAESARSKRRLEEEPSIHVVHSSYRRPAMLAGVAIGEGGFDEASRRLTRYSGVLI
jgi:hypothetical protein